MTCGVDGGSEGEGEGPCVADGCVCAGPTVGLMDEVGFSVGVGPSVGGGVGVGVAVGPAQATASSASESAAERTRGTVTD